MRKLVHLLCNNDNLAPCHLWWSICDYLGQFPVPKMKMKKKKKKKLLLLWKHCWSSHKIKITHTPGWLLIKISLKKFVRLQSNSWLSTEKQFIMTRDDFWFSLTNQLFKKTFTKRSFLYHILTQFFFLICWGIFVSFRNILSFFLFFSLEKL